MNPRVSVLLPLHNCEAYLPETLESLSSQSFEDFEVIAVNDGSSDKTGEILDRHAQKDKRFKPIHTPNGGIVKALNLALLHALGEYCARMDGDDIAHTDRFLEQVKFLDSNPDCVCVGSLYRIINEEGVLVGEQAPFAAFRQTDLKVFPPHVGALPHPSIMLRTASLVDVGGYRHHFPHAEDQDMFLRLSQLGRLDIIQKHLIDYRIHGSSLSSKNVDVQCESALNALLSALAVFEGRSDPFNGVAVNRDEILMLHPDKNFPRLFKHLRNVRYIEARINRQDRSIANRMTIYSLAVLLRDFFNHFHDKRYFGLIKANLRILIRLALRRV
ncbi:glycosyltransferase family 2 protein [Asticcacaulis sp.]|uniref:glycosyltransferase family 2 protein n=1 Tax=Asticcacaulis sp. TaxID=1872648 RepID=UPI0031D52DEF